MKNNIVHPQRESKNKYTPLDHGLQEKFFIIFYDVRVGGIIE
jgi:hypothetical protein